MRSEGGSRTRICSCFAMAPEADAIGDSAERGRARGGGSLAGAGDGGGAGSAELWDRGQAHDSRSSAPCCRAAGPEGRLSGQQLRVSQTDSTPRQPPRPRALRASAPPHVTGSACLRARPRGPEPSCWPRPPLGASAPAHRRLGRRRSAVYLRRACSGGRSGALCGRRGARRLGRGVVLGGPGAASAGPGDCLPAFQVELRTRESHEAPGTSTPSMPRAGGASAGAAGNREGGRGPLKASGWGR